MESGQGKVTISPSETRPRIETPAQTGYRYAIEAFRSYPAYTKVMGARILQLARAEGKDPNVLGSVLLEDGGLMSTFEAVALHEHGKSGNKKAIKQPLDKQIAETYVGKAFKNAAELSILGDEELRHITDKVYGMFDYLEYEGGDPERSINSIIDGMVERARSEAA